VSYWLQYLCGQVPECTEMLQNWVEEMSAFVKQLDPNHMVTIGAEGFWGPGAQRQPANPQASARSLRKSV
jgi:mannan endo-1,4-beta-mannosidase